jgi:hypothetical protein
MVRDNIASEMNALREQMETLLARQRATSGHTGEPAEGVSAGGENQPMQGELQRLQEKVAAFAELLRDETREIPAAGAVAIFALGVLMGRLLPR